MLYGEICWARCMAGVHYSQANVGCHNSDHWLSCRGSWSNPNQGLAQQRYSPSRALWIFSDPLWDNDFGNPYGFPLPCNNPARTATKLAIGRILQRGAWKTKIISFEIVGTSSLAVYPHQVQIVAFSCLVLSNWGERRSLRSVVN